MTKAEQIQKQINENYNRKQQEIKSNFDLIKECLAKYSQVRGKYIINEKAVENRQAEGLTKKHIEEELKAIENEIFETMGKNKKIITYQDENGRNVGMFAAEAGAEAIVLEILDNREASLQQNKWGENLGMVSAKNGLVDATLKALEDREASLQQDERGENIGMYAARRSSFNGLEEYKMEKVVIKALENEEASVQQDAQGWNIGMIAASSYKFEAANFAMQNPEAREQRNVFDYTIYSMMEERKGCLRAKKIRDGEKQDHTQEDIEVLEVLMEEASDDYYDGME